MNLLLLCAGEGTRFRPHTLTLPKPALPFLGIPLACYSLAWAEEISVTGLVANTYHLPREIHRLMKELRHDFPRVSFSDEAPTLMGSGGGIAKAAPFLRGAQEFLVMNGDEVFLPKRSGFMKEALALHRRENRLATLFVMEHPEVGGKFGGVWTDAENKVLGFGKTAVPGARKGRHFIGAALYSERMLSRLSPETASNILYDDLTRAIQEGENVRVHPVEGWWHETGNEVDYLKATADALRLLSEDAPESELLKRALRKYAEEPWTLEKNGPSSTLRFDSSRVSGNAVLEGWNVLGRRTSLEGNSKIRNVVLGTGVQAEDLNAQDRLILS
ncbi:MAG TPA: sugar phosphate nucleotidyltransferase [Pseudobdellovibrionaceae bacterium]|nr:sugar phosphate nucleotidyltransferase [Pseudobdellovibrionaceae bacterium]